MCISAWHLHNICIRDNTLEYLKIYLFLCRYAHLPYVRARKTFQNYFFHKGGIKNFYKKVLEISIFILYLHICIKTVIKLINLDGYKSSRFYADAMQICRCKKGFMNARN